METLDTARMRQTTWPERFSYGFYFFGQGLIYTIVSQYLMYYYTDYVLLPPLVISVILFGGKVWDAVNDTLFGLLMDKLRFRSGKRFLPWLRISTVLIPLTTVLLFSIDKLPGLGWRVALAVLTYLLWDLAYTMCDAPILALSTAMTSNVKERGTLMTFSGIGGALSMALSAILLVPIFDSAGFFKAALVIAAVSLITMSFVCLICKERHHVKSAELQQAATLRETWQYLKGNRYLLLYYGYRVISGSISVSMLTFMTKYCLGDVNYVSKVAMTSLPMIFCVYAASPFLLKRFDKIVLYRASALLTISAYLFTFLVGYENRALVTFCMAVIAALAILPGIMMGVLPQDCIEYGTFKTGIRKEGITFALQSFVAKLTAACASGLTGILLHLIGYKGELAVQSASTVRGIWNCTFLVPLLGQVLAIGLLFVYDLRDRDVQLMSDVNGGRRTREDALAQMSRSYK